MTKVTIADVAREAGVSKPTVSRVLNGRGETSQKTIERVQAAIARLGYRPSSIARSLVTQQTYTLGLIVPDLANPYFAEIAEGAELAAWEQGYNLFLSNIFGSREHEEAALKSFEDRGVDGVIICSTRMPDEKLLFLLKQQRAAVLINRSLPDDVAATIRVDDAWGAKLAVQHLLDRGCRAIGIVAGPRSWPSAQTRMKGFITAMTETGYEPKEAYIVHCPPRLTGAEEVANALLKEYSEIDALLCFNDIVAVGVLRACKTLGIQVPNDIALIGHDDIPLAALVTPSLTTLRVNKHAIGRSAVRMLLDRMQGKSRNMEIVVKSELIVRESSIC